MKLFIGLATIAVTALANPMACKNGIFNAVFQQGFAQGFQADMTSTSTDCFKQSAKMINASNELLRSGNEFLEGLWMRPIQRSNEFLIEMTNQFTVCKSTDFAKQLAVRTSSFSGLFDLVSTVGMGFAMNWITTEEDSTQLYDSFNRFWIDDSCASTSRRFGQALALTFRYEVPAEFYQDQLGFALAEEMGVEV